MTQTLHIQRARKNFSFPAPVAEKLSALAAQAFISETAVLSQLIVEAHQAKIVMAPKPKVTGAEQKKLDAIAARKRSLVTWSSLGAPTWDSWEVGHDAGRLFWMHPALVDTRHPDGYVQPPGALTEGVVDQWRQDNPHPNEAGTALVPPPPKRAPLTPEEVAALPDWDEA